MDILIPLSLPLLFLHKIINRGHSITLPNMPLNPCLNLLIIKWKGRDEDWWYCDHHSPPYCHHLCRPLATGHQSVVQPGSLSADQLSFYPASKHNTISSDTSNMTLNILILCTLALSCLVSAAPQPQGNQSSQTNILQLFISFYHLQSLLTALRWSW